MQINELVDRYIQLRDKKAQLEQAHKDKLAPINAMLDKIEGVNLETHIKGKSPSEVADMKKEIRVLLNRLYDEGLHYIDENPGNIMYGTTVSAKEPRFWIIDYGMIKEAEGEVQVSEI